MDKLLNLEVMKNPLNWVTVFLMLSFAFTAIAIVQRYFDFKKGSEA